MGNILFIGFGGLGDIIMKIPAIRNLKKYYQDSNIEILTNNGPGITILKNCPFVDNIISIGKEKRSRERKIINTLCLALRLRRKKYDISFSSWYGISLIASMFSYIIGAKIRVGFNMNGKGIFYNRRVLINREKHTVEYNLDLLREVEIPIRNKKEEIWIPGDAISYSNDLYNNYDLDKYKFVLSVFPGSKETQKEKRWLPERYSKLINEIYNIYETKIILVGGRLEVEIGKYIEENTKYDIINMINKTNINETAAIIRKSNMMICNDGGIMHLAAGVGTPILSLWGPTDPNRCGPYTEDSVKNVIIKKNNMYEIQVRDVLNKIKLFV